MSHISNYLNRNIIGSQDDYRNSFEKQHFKPNGLSNSVEHQNTNTKTRISQSKALRPEFGFKHAVTKVATFWETRIENEKTIDEIKKDIGKALRKLMKQKQA